MRSSECSVEVMPSPSGAPDTRPTAQLFENADRRGDDRALLRAANTNPERISRSLISLLSLRLERVTFARVAPAGARRGRSLYPRHARPEPADSPERVPSDRPKFRP